ncbi:NYN domain-containing protein [Sphingobium baderi]|uniref:Uncharacterized protein n=1 Tax=Sphingobium baderi TaxID=1332080 RepID=A0A0S3EUS5_9SPHN|nr:NYN domain-containing protein [Sphingobium baderi]ALR19184.1 hypothetical protein ATN00_01550 [Sphingobium baderi]
MRGALYIDGFNLYHAVDDLGVPHYKWCNFWKLAELISKGQARSITRVVFCTAYFKGDHGKRVRHEALVNAQAIVGVETKLGHTTTEPMKCKRHSCGHRWDQPREKETDINLSLSLFADACDDVFDVAFLLTADTDQAATISFFRNRFPDKRIVNVIPPGRMPSQHLANLAHGKIRMTANHLDTCALPEMVAKDGFKTIYRPAEYAPPPGWVHPDDRP